MCGKTKLMKCLIFRCLATSLIIFPLQGSPEPIAVSACCPAVNLEVLFSRFWRLCKILVCTSPIVRNSKHLLTIAHGNGIFPIWKNIFYLIILNQILTRFVMQVPTSWIGAYHMFFLSLFPPKIYLFSHLQLFICCYLSQPLAFPPFCSVVASQFELLCLD